MAAPVCHIPPVVTSPTLPGPRSMPSIPPPGTTLQSALVTIDALRRAVQQLAGQNNQSGNNFNDNTGFGRKPEPNNGGNWHESSRSTEQVKVYNPDDKTQYITVERINSLTMKSGNNTWTWRR